MLRRYNAGCEVEDRNVLRLNKDSSSVYLAVGPILHKCLETGFSRRFSATEGFDVYWRFRTKGDHAGLTFFVQLWSWCFFEFNVHDDRHWNYEEDRFFGAGEYEKYLDTPADDP